MGTDDRPGPIRGRSGSSDDRGDGDRRNRQGVPGTTDRAVGLVLPACGVLGLGGLSAGPVLVATFLSVAAGACFPAIRRRIAPDHPGSTFEYAKSIAERPVEDPGQVCDGPIDRGVERTSRAELVVAGTTPTTTEEGHDHHRESCVVAGSDATVDRPGSGTGEDGERDAGVEPAVE